MVMCVVARRRKGRPRIVHRRWYSGIDVSGCFCACPRTLVVSCTVREVERIELLQRARREYLGEELLARRDQKHDEQRK